jgi:hypothetical protein
MLVIIVINANIHIVEIPSSTEFIMPCLVVIYLNTLHLENDIEPKLLNNNSKSL